MAQADSAYHAHNLRRVLDHAFQLAEQAGREQDAHRREALIGECMQVWRLAQRLKSITKPPSGFRLISRAK